MRETLIELRINPRIFSRKETDDFVSGLPSFLDHTTTVYANSLTVEYVFALTTDLTNDDEGLYDIVIAADTSQQVVSPLSCYITLEILP